MGLVGVRVRVSHPRIVATATRARAMEEKRAIRFTRVPQVSIPVDATVGGFLLWGCMCCVMRAAGGAVGVERPSQITRCGVWRQRRDRLDSSNSSYVCYVHTYSRDTPITHSMYVHVLYTVPMYDTMCEGDAQGHFRARPFPCLHRLQHRAAEHAVHHHPTTTQRKTT